jgi:pyruvate dehydrogenase E1 component alpha subunit
VTDPLADAYADLPPEVRRQRDELLQQIEAFGDDAFLREG